jgi:hypothetical protein
MRRMGGNWTRTVPAENTPSANQSKKKETHTVVRLGMNTATKEFGNALLSLTSDF